MLQLCDLSLLSQSTLPGPAFWQGSGALLLPQSGDILISIAGQARLVGAGMAALLPPHEAVLIVAQSDDLLGWVVLFAGAELLQNCPPLPNEAVVGRVAPDISQRLVAALGRMTPQSLNASEQEDPLTTVTALIAELRTGLCVLQPGPRDQRALCQAFLSRAKAAQGTPHTLADLAAQMGTSTAVLDQACQVLRGRRAIDVLNDVRLEVALALLRSGVGPAAVAQRLAYSNVAHLTRAVSAATGRGPRAFGPSVRLR